ncbi:urease accessory protein UreH domain-containing protein [Thermospira aquatica]|uniref:Sulfite exporter TauE/SafE family protein n=1 Tax=Thermospira aquatica TaxID=2828656 RepID=A0AAX3BFZ4_9SPIR|nr:sulfite exporter TauE/SafE family protein [Thermospira aquatica]URA11263.1 sulfite exporter TauE/SafE family protein [Thermospira aquatica]
MEKKEVKLNVRGMSCNACEIRIEEVLSKEEGIYNVKAKRNKNMVILSYNPQKIDLERIKSLINELGYKVEGVLTNESGNLNFSFIPIFITSGVILVFFILQNKLGIHFLPVITKEMGYGILFVVGLLTSFHCVGMCGGINLTQSLHKDKNNFIPSLKYNIGRLIAYTLIGGIFGGIGTLFSLSSFSKGFIFIIAGIFMITMGLNLFGIFSLGNFLSKFFSQVYAKVNKKGKLIDPFFVGILNGLMPCGPLQGMQIYALSSGSFFTGALSMFFFALGTLPLMLGLGVLVNFLSKKVGYHMMKVSGLIVIFLGISMLSNGLALTGNPLFKEKDKNYSVAKLNGDLQTVITEIEPNRYPPIVVEKGKPVKWIIKVSEENLNSCNNAIVIPALGIEKRLIPGENIIEFTPTNEGNIYYSCWMGMISSTIKVVNNINQSDIVVEENIGGGGSCCASGNIGRYSGGKLPLDSIGIAKIKDGFQEVVINVDENGYSPSVIVLQKNIQAKIIFNPKKLTSCNYVVIFPEYRGRLDLSVGQWETPLLNVSEDFTFTCWMGMLNGYAKVVEDLRKVDIQKIQKELENYRSPRAGGCCGG